MDLGRWRQLVAEGKAAASALPPTSPTRAVASDDWFARLRSADPPYGNEAPPLLLHLCRLDEDALLAFDADLEAIQEAMPPGGSRQDFLRFGQRHGVTAERHWTAGLVELGVQAHLLRELGTGRTHLSPRLPNGGQADVAIDLASRRVWLEVSVLSDGELAVEEFDTAKSVQTMLSDPYADAGRVYSKVFSKTWGSRKERRGQLHPDQPSLVLVGDVTWRSPGYASPAYGWALDQLTDPTQRDDESRASLHRWLEEAYGDRASDTLASLSALSAVAVVSTELSLLDFRPNQSADEAHRLTSAETDALRNLLEFSHPEA